MAKVAGLALLIAVFGTAASANQIERACMKSDRAGGDRSLCGCIQDAANLTLDSRDQRLAATFFQDPDRAQQIRMSDHPQHEIFWKRYKNFGAAAEAFCSRK